MYIVSYHNNSSWSQVRRRYKTTQDVSNQDTYSSFSGTSLSRLIGGLILISVMVRVGGVGGGGVTA